MTGGVGLVMGLLWRFFAYLAAVLCVLVCGVWIVLGAGVVAVAVGLFVLMVWIVLGVRDDWRDWRRLAGADED
jgi:hypothetical protein